MAHIPSSQRYNRRSTLDRMSRGSNLLHRIHIQAYLMVLQDRMRHHHERKVLVRNNPVVHLQDTCSRDNFRWMDYLQLHFLQPTRHWDHLKLTLNQV